MTITPANRFQERLVWEQTKGRWRLVHGDMLERGFSLEFHDFSLKAPLDWSASFHEQTVEICINLHGGATIKRGSSLHQLADNEVAVYTVPGHRPQAVRQPEGHHCFYTLEFSCEWLRKHLAPSLHQLKPEILHFLERPDRARAYVERFALPLPMIPIRIDLLAPPVSEAASDAWYFGKIFEILALTIFKPRDAIPAARRRNRERAEIAKALVESTFENPLTLEDLAREAGCSPYHLSRTFHREFGISISLYLRAVRMEKAAEYLRQGMSVTETSVAVGYSNVSAFIKTFGLHHCTTPARWAAAWTPKEKGGKTASPRK